MGMIPLINTRIVPSWTHFFMPISLVIDSLRAMEIIVAIDDRVITNSEASLVMANSFCIKTRMPEIAEFPAVIRIKTGWLLLLIYFFLKLSFKALLKSRNILDFVHIFKI